MFALKLLTILKSTSENMHNEILTGGQKEILPLLPELSYEFGLVGGTAVALYLGHRRSIDFDLFSQDEFDNEEIRSIIRKDFNIEKTFIEKPGELTILVNGVKITFFKYPFEINFDESFEDIIKLPDLIILASMKAHSLGRRAKWKDYVDLFFIFKKYSLKQLTQKAKKIFKGEFNERLFREQLAYFNDIDYSESIDFMKGYETSDEEIKNSLIEVSLQ